MTPGESVQTLLAASRPNRDRYGEHRRVVRFGVLPVILETDKQRRLLGAVRAGSPAVSEAPAERLTGMVYELSPKAYESAFETTCVACSVSYEDFGCPRLPPGGVHNRI